MIIFITQRFLNANQQVVRQHGNKQVSFGSRFVLMVNRANAQIRLERTKRFLDLREGCVQAPDFGRF